jgi:DNA-binding beta-propeller fold protein YncE
MRNSLLLLLLIGSACILSSVEAPPPDQMQVGAMYGNRVLVTTNQLLNPAGRRVTFPGRPLDIAISPRGDLVAVLLNGSVQLFGTAGAPVRSVGGISATTGGIAFQPDGSQFWISEVSGAALNRIRAITIAGSSGKIYSFANSTGPVGIAIDRAGRFAYVALNLSNQLARVDLASGKIDTTPVGIAPLAVALSPDNGRIFVTNQGGIRPAPGQTVAPSAGTSILIDDRGIARSGSLSVVDTAAFKSIAELPTGLLPSGVAVSPEGTLVAVANSNSDSLTFFYAGSLERHSTVPIRALPEGFGSSPTGLAFSPDGDFLYVTCSGNNSVAVLSRQHVARRRSESAARGPGYSVAGAFPTDWYPMSIAAGRDGAVYVANVKGIGTRNASARYNINNWMGTVNILAPQEIAASLGAVTADANQPFRNAVVPPGSPQSLHSLGIEHVFLIIKENRTYDQVLGDLGIGNGDPSLTTYGAAVTPNHHALASQFTLLDNYFASGTVSPDGHQWLAQSIVTPYLERAHGAYPRSYPYSGEDPLAFSPAGFLWTNAQAHGLSVRIYGEYTLAARSYPLTWSAYLQDAAGPMQSATPSNSSIAAMNPLVEHDYPSFALNVPDSYRARRFLDRFQDFQASGTLPNLVILQMPADHTVGTAANSPTPNSMVADNDVAVARVVEAISNSSAWPKSAIIITEDDAQDGVDHVDGHRTVCLVISPYTRRRTVDSTHYNHTSVVRTIEELLGLPPMNKFDAAALPMRSVFTTRPDFTRYYALSNNVPLDQVNPGPASLTGPALEAAIASQKMNFAVPDAAPEEELNRILWHAARGWKTPYPGVLHGPGCPREKD